MNSASPKTAIPGPFALWLTLLVAGTAAADSDRPLGVKGITRKLQTGDRLVIATFGDSITWPCFHTDFRQNYITFTVDALRKEFPKANVEIVHAGNMGTAARGLANERFERHVLSHRPDAVVLMFGMNDCLAGEAGLDSFDRSLTALVEMARKQGAVPIIATQNEILYESRDGRPRRDLALYMNRALQVAAREQVPAADCFSAWKPLLDRPAELSPRLNDWIHPNLAGHRLMAKSVLQALWPEAAAHVSDVLRPPLRPEEAAATACLVPGPPGKQVLRTSAGDCVALSGRQRNGRLVDLVFSYTRKSQPTWEDFDHVSLIGRGAEAVFDNMDRILTAALLLEQENRVWVVFSWNIGVYAVSVDLEQAGQPTRLREPGAWLEKSDSQFVRPVALANSLTGAGLLHDAYLQPDGQPAVFYAARNLASTAGWEVNEGLDGIAILTSPPPGSNDDGYDFRFPEYHAATCVLVGGETPVWTAQKTAGELTVLGEIGSQKSVSPKLAIADLILPEICAPSGLFGVVAYAAERGEKWAVVEWQDAVVFRDIAPPENRSSNNMVPLPWSDGTKNGVCWVESSHGGAARRPPAYGSRLAPDAHAIGVLSAVEQQLKFTFVGIDEPTPK